MQEVTHQPTARSAPAPCLPACAWCRESVLSHSCKWRFWRPSQKTPALQLAVLHVADATINLAFVARRVRLGPQDHRFVMLGERLQTRVQLRIVPVRMLHKGLEVIDHQRLAPPRSAKTRSPGTATDCRCPAERSTCCGPSANSSGGAKHMRSPSPAVRSQGVAVEPDRNRHARWSVSP